MNVNVWHPMSEKPDMVRDFTVLFRLKFCSKIKVVSQESWSPRLYPERNWDQIWGECVSLEHDSNVGVMWAYSDDLKAIAEERMGEKC